ncbi:hypothetical protein [Oceaniglobus roseus]|uniref:hypothetical protein n=1 Tax=Oceaniglobus roseus TaxID=1737570 RepID=UPI000C7EC02B|nr:hypothetical protein [Kandeliimicrobium roseum]
MWRLVLAAALVAGVAQAEERESYAVDFAALFRDKAELVEDRTKPDGPGTRVLQLGPVTVTELQNENATEYLATDTSPEGAVGCLLRILAELRQVEPCGEVMSPDQAEAIEGAFGRVLSFYVANTWPPVPEAERAEAVNAILADYDRTRAPAEEVCPTLDAATLSEASRMAGAISDGIKKGAVEQMLATPRLPVTNPCL